MRSGAGYTGPLYLEVVPRSFAIKVRTGDSSIKSGSYAEMQRFRIPLSKNCTAPIPALPQCVLAETAPSEPSSGQTRTVLRIDLTGSAHEDTVIGYRAKKNSHVIDLAKIGHYAALDFWEPLKRHRHDSLLLEPEEFYILASKERIRVPSGYAAENGGVRTRPAVNYARTMRGFFDPGFGYGDGTMRGTQVVLEVRPHDVPFLIHDGQTFFKVVYDRMLTVPSQVYGTRSARHTNDKPSPSANILRPEHATSQRPPRSLYPSVLAAATSPGR